MAIYGHIWTQFFIDARDGSAGGRVGRADVARIDEKLQEERPVLIFDHIIFWPDLPKNAIFRNPSKKMRLDESFRMVPVSCHLEVVVKSYGQNTVNMSRNKKRNHRDRA